MSSGGPPDEERTAPSPPAGAAAASPVDRRSVGGPRPATGATGRGPRHQTRRPGDCDIAGKSNSRLSSPCWQLQPYDVDGDRLDVDVDRLDADVHVHVHVHLHLHVDSMVPEPERYAEAGTPPRLARGCAPPSESLTTSARAFAGNGQTTSGSPKLASSLPFDLIV